MRSRDGTSDQVLKPFGDLGLKDQLVLVENLEFTRDNSIPNLDEQHWTGTTQMLSGKTPTAYGDKARNATIDQYLGAKIGAGMPHPSLYMSLFAAMTCSFQADQSRVMPNNEPLDVFKKVFGGLSTTAPDAAVLRRLARRQSVLDSVAKDVAEAQLAAKMKGSRCTNPIIDPTLKYSDPMNLPATMRAFIDITVAAMACDQTRVVLISNFPSDNSYDYSCPYAPVNAPDAAHHALSHGGTNTNPDQSANQNGWLLERQFQHQMMAELAKKLKDIPEGTGTMLDNTVILIPSEVGGRTPTPLRGCS